MIDRKMSYQKLSARSDEDILGILQKLYPERELYNFSLGWRDSSEYILKARGAKGDVIVDWRERKDVL